MDGRLPLTCLVLMSLAGCAGVESTRQPERSTKSPPASRETPTARDEDAGARLAAAAELLVGSPYRFGGSGPEGFDCSGLVYFVHRELGMDVPRTAARQFRSARPVARAVLRPGDLVFFRDGSQEVTHVGVFIGNDAFVHAPKSGRPVGYARLDDEYYAVNFAGAGRLH